MSHKDRGQVVVKGGHRYLLSRSGFLPVSFEVAEEIRQAEKPLDPVEVAKVEKKVEKLERAEASSSPEPEDIFAAIEKSLGLMKVSKGKKDSKKKDYHKKEES